MKNLSNSKNYRDAAAYTERERLPVGGYVLKILGVEYQEKERGNSIILSFDIVEGEHKDFFAANYRAQTGEDKKWKGTYRLREPKDDGSQKDEWTMRRFKTTVEAFEESNPGFHFDWDEQKFKGKLIGALFNNKEYDINGRRGFYTNCHSLVTVDKIRSGKFTVPSDKLLKDRPGRTHSTGGSQDSDGFMSIPDGADEALPFD